ncbi:adenylate kinase 7-like [Nylanderia fulva]|uniref:adenylate kinase 7-like n=1 Tax=Nylanderia fulva TaxID=613905 RepID=UPI0010FB7C62|nr:adenylate kinase 7-like [Nylanderia fulva]
MEATRKRAEAETRAAEAAEKLRKEREFLEHKRQREEKMKDWTNLLEKLKQEEEERLCILAEPLRQYLTKYVFPTLTEALIEVAKLRPEDPIDFLAEYLFKKNPEGKMFEPDYTETMSMLLDAIGRQQNDVLPSERLKADIEKFLKKQDELSTADEIEKSEMQDVCEEIKTISIFSEQTSEYEEIDDFEKEELNFTEQIIDEFGGEA